MHKPKDTDWLGGWKHVHICSSTYHITLLTPRILGNYFSVVVQSLSQVQPFATPRTVAHQAFLFYTISRSLLKLMSIESVIPFNHRILCFPLSSCLQSFPASESFLMHQLFASGGRSTGASASALVLPMKIQEWFPLGMTGVISL